MQGNDVFDRERILTLFRKLDAAMSETGAKVNMYVVGGAAIALSLENERVTSDIDAVYDDTVVDAYVKRIALEEELPSDWLNHSVQAVLSYFNKDTDPKTIFTGSSISIQSASPEFVLAMKLASRREKDIDDIVLLTHELGIISKNELIKAVQRYFKADLTAAAYQRQQIENFIDMIMEERLLSFSDKPKPSVQE